MNTVHTLTPHFCKITFRYYTLIASIVVLMVICLQQFRLNFVVITLSNRPKGENSTEFLKVLITLFNCILEEFCSITK
jgi:hypothetical protein